MSVKDTQYMYIPSQERLVKVSEYVLGPVLSSTAPSVAEGHRRNRHPNKSYETCGDDVEASTDFDMRNVRWSETTVSVSDLLALKFPVIMKAVNGYTGNDGLKLDAEQIMQVYRSHEQLRVSAVDSTGRTLTFPTDFPLTVRQLTHSTVSDQSQSISQLLERVSLPVTVEVIHVERTDSSKTIHASSTLSDSRMTLLEISSQRFLLANAITRGWLDQSRFILIPEQLNLEFRLAVGTWNTTSEEWKDVCGMYNMAARHFKFHLISNYEGVIYDDWVIQAKPSVFQPEEEEAEHKNNLDSTSKKTRCQLQWQQVAISQGSLPSLPTAVTDSTTCAHQRTESTHSGFVTPPHLSTESLQPCVSTESLLPRGSIDSGASDKSAGTAVKQKSIVPSRLRRRKAESKRQEPCQRSDHCPGNDAPAEANTGKGNATQSTDSSANAVSISGSWPNKNLSSNPIYSTSRVNDSLLHGNRTPDSIFSSSSEEAPDLKTAVSESSSSSSPGCEQRKFVDDHSTKNQKSLMREAAESFMHGTSEFHLDMGSDRNQSGASKGGTSSSLQGNDIFKEPSWNSGGNRKLFNQRRCSYDVTFDNHSSGTESRVWPPVFCRTSELCNGTAESARKAPSQLRNVKSSGNIPPLLSHKSIDSSSFQVHSQVPSGGFPSPPTACSI